MEMQRRSRIRLAVVVRGALIVALGWVLVCGVASGLASAEDWGAYSLVPVSAPGMVLEAVGSGTAEGTVVSIGRPVDAENQKWIITPKGDGFCTIRPAYSAKLVLAVAGGGTKNGTQIVLETDQGKPWQQWTIRKSEMGTYSLHPRHAPDKGLDDLGGNASPGAKQDLWAFRPNDAHLQWRIRPLAGSPAPTEPPPSTYVAPKIPPEQVLPGTIKQSTFTESKIFPGTERDVTVFVPAQYDGSKPACVYVKTDGFRPQEKPILEEMIAAGEMPVTIGVFVRPGTVPAPMKGTLGRRNRCFEYDGLGDNNARFFVEEILPYVAKEYGLKLTDSGNDRCIAGGSSGGITAFNAAWERPDAFSRVYAVSGSFVAFRGGHQFPTMVRKFEPRPIRAFLTTATHDMENCAGDWFLLDQEMDKALKFSGYDYFFRIVEGRHGGGYFDNFREAMAFLWKDWPKPVEAGAGAPRVQDILVPGEGWQLAAEGLHEARGPACNAEGEVFFVDVPENRIERIDRQGRVQPLRADAGWADGLSVGADGRLYAVSSKTGKVMSYDASGGDARVVAEGIFGRYVLAMPNGSLYVTGSGDKPGGPASVWLVNDGHKTLVDSSPKSAAGLAYRPDQWLLSVADGPSKWVHSYQIGPDGALVHHERFFWLHFPDWEDDAGAESVCYAREGQMFVGTRWGIQVCADDGPTQVILPMPDRTRVWGVCLGGPDMDTLFAFCGPRIWKRKVQVHAMGAFSPWTAVKGTKL